MGSSPAACAAAEGSPLATDVRFDALAAELQALFARGGPALDDAAFERWALRLFAWQFAHNRAYRGYCEGRGVTPGTVSGWRDVPPVPTSAFKHVPLLSVEEGRVPEALFRTSGTTRGAERRGEHPVASLALYRASLLPPFRAHVLAGAADLSLISLVPSPEHAPHSSLSRMIGAVAEAMSAAAPGLDEADGTPGPGALLDAPPWFAEGDGSLRLGALLDAASAAASEARPVLITATAFALVHWLDALAQRGFVLRLPEGSRLMETGGFKGRAREVSRVELYRAVQDRLGIPARRVVNEYGMTEMLSQFYEPVLSDPSTPAAPQERVHVGPDWVRTRVLDPVTLAELPAGRPGLLCHFDLANAGSVCAVLTEDVGVAASGGFRLLGRAQGAEPRGCSLATEDLLRADALAHRT